MFESPTRNHFSIVFERAGAVIAFLLVLVTNHLKDVGWEIFTVDYYRSLWHMAVYEGKRSVLIGLAGFAALVWYLYISVRYWKRTTFYIDGVDFVYERKTMFRASSRLPIQNIAVVNVERNIFERLIGTAKVKIDLNSSRTANSTDFKFVLREQQALQLKEKLMGIKQSLTGEETAEEDEQTQKEPREQVAFFTVGEALRHKLLFVPVIQTLTTLTVLFVLPQLRISGDYDMSRLWYLLIIAVIGWVFSLVNGTLNLGNYKVERDSRMIYISCGVLNQRHYMFETEKINAVLIRKPLLARMFGMASIDLAVVGFGNERNETTHLSLVADKEQIEAILRACVPEFVCSEPPRHCHALNIVWPILRAFLLGAGTFAALVSVYRNAYVFALIVLGVALFGAILEFAACDFAKDDHIVRYTGGTFNKQTGIFKYGDVQSMEIRTNLFYRLFGIGRLRFAVLGASAVRKHKTGLFPIKGFEEASVLMVAHEDNVLLGKYGKTQQS